MGGGWGSVTRIFDVLLVVIVYGLMEIYYRSGWRAREWFAVLIVALIQILSGAKSAVLNLVFIVALHAFFTGVVSQKGAAVRGLLFKLTAAAFVGFLLVAQVQKSDVEVEGKAVPLLGQAAMRLVNNGDAFIYAYSDGFVDRIEGTDPVGALFGEYLAFFRIRAPERLPLHIGAQIANEFIGPDAGSQTNAKHNVFGYVYFGLWGSILYSYALGTFIGSVRYKALTWMPRTWVAGVSYVILNVAVYSQSTTWTTPRGRSLTSSSSSSPASCCWVP